jgi:hypothetical protein
MHVLQQLSRVPKYISDLGIWLWRIRPLVWIVVAITVAFAFWFLASPCLERAIRLSGMGLQLIGVMLLAVGLRDTRRAFDDQPTTWQGIKQAWAGRPRFKPKHVILAASGAALGIAGGSARLTVSPGPNTTLEGRLVILERGHAALFDEVGKLSEEVKQKVGELSNAVAVERNERQQADKGIADKLKKAVAEGLPLGRVGAICFFIGIIGASVSLEIASWFGRVACQ